MDKQAKSRLLGIIMLLAGFILMTLYPYAMYFRGERIAFEVIKATLTIVIVLLSMIMISIGVNLCNKE